MDQHMGIVHTVHPYHCVVHYWEAVNTYMQQHFLEISLCFWLPRYQEAVKICLNTLFTACLYCCRCCSNEKQ